MQPKKFWYPAHEEDILTVYIHKMHMSLRPTDSLLSRSTDRKIFGNSYI